MEIDTGIWGRLCLALVYMGNCLEIMPYRKMVRTEGRKSDAESKHSVGCLLIPCFLQTCPIAQRSLARTNLNTRLVARY